MTSASRPSYVLGNSWQLNHLSRADRARLDEEPFVGVCNLFPEHWRQLSFRPTFWAMGDTYNPPGCEVLARQLAVIRDDDELRARLQHIFVCIESDPARQIIAHSELPVTIYRRGNWERRGQPLAQTLDETIFHYGSTLTDVVNLALILNPDAEVRLAGCQRSLRSGHFYHEGEAEDAHPPVFPLVIRRMWEGLGDLARDGVPLVDCHPEHELELDHEFPLPRGDLFPTSASRTSDFHPPHLLPDVPLLLEGRA